MRPRKTSRASLYDGESYRQLLASLAVNLRRLREQRGWTQEQAAERCDLSLIQYARVETRKTNVTFVTLARLADGFGVPPAQLLAAQTEAVADTAAEPGAIGNRPQKL